MALHRLGQPFDRWYFIYDDSSLSGVEVIKHNGPSLPNPHQETDN